MTPSKMPMPGTPISLRRTACRSPGSATAIMRISTHHWLTNDTPKFMSRSLERAQCAPPRYCAETLPVAHDDAAPAYWRSRCNGINILMGFILARCRAGAGDILLIATILSSTMKPIGRHRVYRRRAPIFYCTSRFQCYIDYSLDRLGAFRPRRGL